jgi:glucans biosynthesis protein
MFTIDRRLLLAGLSSAILPQRASFAANGPSPSLGEARPFSLDLLTARAKKLATKPYIAPQPRAASMLKGINFDAMWKIKFRLDRALYHGTGAAYPIAFFHLSKLVWEGVRIYALERGKAREILYSPDYFDYSGSGIDPKILGDLRFAGFRVMDGQDKQTDWLAFQGASYFRSAGADGQYGASARGIALNTALATGEEFPRFTEFWLEEHGPVVTIYALLEGPSITGAYKFDAVKNETKDNPGVVTNVACHLFFRAAITRLGVAPLTSMYWYGENERRKAVDWRPEIHDSDGLSLWTGKGERVWRPLVNPPTTQTNSFVDNNPKGFGLMQRDRDFDDYQDDGAFYNKRPGIWVEPKGNWGAGAVQLVEIPTDDEIHDNVVAYWRPDGNIAPGDTRSFEYRLYWQDFDPAFPKTLGHVVATRQGRGGQAGSNIGNAPKRKFVIDFTGGPLAQLEQRYDLKPDLWVSHGSFDNPYVVKVVGTNRWRAVFDLNYQGKGPIDMRCALRMPDGKLLTETWVYQFFP